MKRHSFFWKLFTGNLLLVGVIIIVAGQVSYRRLNADYMRDHAEAQGQMATAARRCFEQAWPMTALEVKETTLELVAGSKMRLTVISREGTVLGDSQTDPLGMENHMTKDRTEILAAMSGDEAQAVRRSGTLGLEFRYMARPITKDGQVQGVVRVAMPVLAIAHGQGLIRESLLWAAGVALVVAVAIALMLSLLWNAPLKQIAHAARAMAAGDLTGHTRITGSDELAELGLALNEMRQSLAGQIETIATQRQHLAAVVENLREGVVALDSHDHIVLMNPSARELLGSTGGSSAEHVQDAVRVTGVLDALTKVSLTGHPINRQIEVDGGQGPRRILDLHAAKVEQVGDDDIALLLVVRDISAVARAAAMKAEFVANASHELRTPLATIRAAVDSLAGVESDDTDAIEHMIRILSKHVTRLEHMTNDLLDLHIVESGRQEVNPETITLESLKLWCIENYGQAAKDRQVSLEIEASAETDEFRTDRTLVQLIVGNLLDNAIKFTPHGGSISCQLEKSGVNLKITVSDTGCGIPVELQRSVFDRFFQVEQSRAGDTQVRGTGLGLAIVKHASERLGGQVDLQSKGGEGTTVKLVLPPLVD